MKIVAWISAGVSSFVAAHLVRERLSECRYIHIDDQHPDSLRFVSDCEKLLGIPVTIQQSDLKCVESALRKAAAIRFPHGAPCTNLLKKRIRKEWEKTQTDSLAYVWGLDADERERADRIRDAMPNQGHLFPLIDAGMTKQDAHGYSRRLGLKRPEMYDLGYNNNNCVGCVKGGMGYWNKIRRDFPSVFESRAKLERLLGHSCLRGVFLDELDPERGWDEKGVMEDCGIACEVGLLT